MDYYCQCKLATLSFFSLIARLQCYMCSTSLKRPVVHAWRSSCLIVARRVFNSIHVLDNTLTVEEVSGNLIYCVIASWWPVFFPSCGFSLYRLELLRSGPSSIFQLDFGIYKSVIIFYHSNTTSALLQKCLFFFWKNLWAETCSKRPPCGLTYFVVWGCAFKPGTSAWWILNCGKSMRERPRWSFSLKPWPCPIQ